MSKTLHNLPIYPRREDFDSEADYLYAVENWNDIYNEAEDLAMERHYERKFKDR